MKVIHSTLLAAALVFLAPAMGSDVSLDWVRLGEQKAVLGTYVHVGTSIEVFTFLDTLCMLTVHPREEGSTTAEEITLGWTDPGEWRITEHGLIEVRGRVLKEPLYFALVRFDGHEGLLRLPAATASVPDRIEEDSLRTMFYQREVGAEPDDTENSGQSHDHGV